MSTKYNLAIPATHYNAFTAIARSYYAEKPSDLMRRTIEGFLFKPDADFPLDVIPTGKETIKPLKVYPSALSTICLTLTISDEAAELLEHRAKKHYFKNIQDATREILRQYIELVTKLNILTLPE